MWLDRTGKPTTNRLVEVYKFCSLKYTLIVRTCTKMLTQLKSIANGTMIFVTGCTLNTLQVGLYLVSALPFLEKFANTGIAFLVRVHILQIIHTISYDNIKIYIKAEDKEHVGKESCIVLANHRHHGDFLYIMPVAETMGFGDNCRVFLKNILKYTPVLGPMNFFAGSLFLKRSLEEDAPAVQKFSKNMADTARARKLEPNSSARDSLFLMFAEGTRITDQKLKKSNEVAKAKFDLEPLENLLHPKPSGFYMLQKEIRDAPIGTYILTMLVVDENDKITPHGPSIAQLMSGEHANMKIHCQIKRLGSVYDEISDSNGEVSKAECTKLLNREWRQIDADIDHMKTHGSFPAGYDSTFITDQHKNLAKQVYTTSMVFTAGLFGFLATKLSLSVWAGIGGTCFVLGKIVGYMTDPKNSSFKTFENNKKK